MDAEARKELSCIIEKLTHSGDPSLDQTLMKRLKTLCKSSDLVVRAAYGLLIKDMSKRHAEIRLSSFQVCNELYRRSHIFRELVTDDFRKIVTLLCGVESKEPLPPPKEAAEKMKKESLLAIKQWVEKYGDGYPKLKLGYNFLKHNKKVDFDSLVAASEVEVRKREERERRNKALLEQRLRDVKTEYRETLSEIRLCVKEMESCFEILMPSFNVQHPESHTSNIRTEMGFCFGRSDSRSSGSFVSIEDSIEWEEEGKEIERGEQPVMEAVSTKDMAQKNGTEDDRNGTEDESDSEVEWEEVGTSLDTDRIDGRGFDAHGMIGTGWNVTFELPDTVQVVEEHNEGLIEVLRERHRLLTGKYLRTIGKWMEWFTKGDEQALLKEVIDLKALIVTTCEKYNELNIVSNTDEQTHDIDEGGVASSSKGAGPLLSPRREESGLFSSHEGRAEFIINELVFDPTTPQAQLATAATSRNLATLKSKNPANSLRKGEVPTVPFDVDLINWTNPKAPAPTVASIGSLNQFWCEDKEAVVSEDHRKGLKCRVISFPGEFQPIMRTCRAPLGDGGKLCPRRDRCKCPFHGVIIPRDEFGVPAADDYTSDPCLPLSEEGKRKGGKRKRKAVKHPGLTDLKKMKDTPQTRIEQKILNKRTLKRVAEKMARLEGKLKRDKFSDNFNYALKQ